MVDPILLVFHLALGAMASLPLALIAYRRHSLSLSGFIAFIVVGIILYGFGGWSWYAGFLLFFISASLWTIYKHKEKKYLDTIAEKTGPRDMWQAAANVGISLVWSIIYAFAPSSLVVAGFLGALAAANADTWASELGSLSKVAPRMITTLKPAEPGRSGAVSVLGTIAGVVGSVSIALIGGLFLHLEGDIDLTVSFVSAVALGGTIGFLMDSLLGATVQARYFCTIRNIYTEQTSYSGVPTQLVYGIRWINNDWVNLLCTITGALVSIILLNLML